MPLGADLAPFRGSFLRLSAAPQGGGVRGPRVERGAEADNRFTTAKAAAAQTAHPDMPGNTDESMRYGWAAAQARPNKAFNVST